MTRAAHITTALGAIGLTVLLACGGSSGGGSNSPTIASNLSYTNPTAGDYKLVRDASSTTGHLILNVVGPASTSLSGVGFILTADATKVSWAAMSGTEKVSSTFFTSPLVESKVTGSELQAGIYQKGMAAAVTTGATSVLATVALDLKSGTTSGKVSLAATAGKAIILNPPSSPTATTSITIAVGTLVAN